MLVPKPHSWIELDATAFNHNINIYRNIIGKNTILCVALKSDAYGHGIKQMGKICQENDTVDWICTASLSEALILRNENIIKPILVLSLIDEDPALALTHAIDLPVFDLSTAELLNEIGRKHNKKFSIHIKIDSGMSRFGFIAQEGLEPVQHIARLPFISINGIYTHCAESGNPEQSFTLKQLHAFDLICQQIEQAGIHIPFRHASNSAAASTVHPLFASNFIRLGAGTYGLWHFRNSPEEHPNLNLKSVMTWKTRVCHIKKVPANTFIGYDRTYQTTRETIIATIPVGYYDGYDRRFTNQGIMKINDYYAKVVGRICMNATKLEIPEGHTVSLGDEVILLGDHDNLRAHDLAKTIHSFNAREITTRLSPHLERRIVNEVTVVNSLQKNQLSKKPKMYAE